MKIETTEKGHIVLKEVYSGLTLETNSGETISICMRDSGFEVTYEGKNYTAQKGVINLIGEMDDPTAGKIKFHSKIGGVFGPTQPFENVKRYTCQDIYDLLKNFLTDNLGAVYVEVIQRLQKIRPGNGPWTEKDIREHAGLSPEALIKMFPYNLHFQSIGRGIRNPQRQKIDFDKVEKEVIEDSLRARDEYLAKTTPEQWTERGKVDPAFKVNDEEWLKAGYKSKPGLDVRTAEVKERITRKDLEDGKYPDAPSGMYGGLSNQTVRHFKVPDDDYTPEVISTQYVDSQQRGQIAPVSCDLKVHQDPSEIKVGEQVEHTLGKVRVFDIITRKTHIVLDCKVDVGTKFGDWETITEGRIHTHNSFSHEVKYIGSVQSGNTYQICKT